MEMLFIGLFRMVWNVLMMWGFLGVILWFGAATLPPVFKPFFGLYKSVSKKAAVELAGLFGVVGVKVLKIILNFLIWIVGLAVVGGMNLFARMNGSNEFKALPAWKDHFPHQKKDKKSGAGAGGGHH